MAPTLEQPPAAEGWQRPRDISFDGWRIDHLIDFALVAITILFIIMVVWMLYACIQHGEKHRAEYDHGDSKRWRMAKVAIGATIFVGVDGVLLLNSVHDLESSLWNFKGAMSDPAAVRIELNARQWSWQARYAGPDGKFNTADDVVALNDIRIPVDTPVIFQLSATDVLHCLYIPNLRIKQDIVPGMITMATTRAKETGEFEIGCAQHCGVNHYKMRGTITVLSREDYRRWLEAASKDGARAYDPKDADAHWGWPWREI
jgi:cytochrome c oxidase subunit 2